MRRTPSALSVSTALRRAALKHSSLSLAVALGLVVMLAYGLVTDPPASPAQLFIYGLVGVLIGLGAVGLYDLVKLSGTSPQRPDSSERTVDLE